MAPILVRRRRDGLVQIRRVRVGDVVLAHDTKLLCGLFAGFLAFTLLLFFTLLFDPPLLAVGLWAIVAAAVDAGRLRPGRRPPVLKLVPGTLPPPPHGAA